MGLITTTRAIEIQPALEAFSTAEIQTAIDSASKFVESWCGRIFSLETVVNEVIRTDQFGYHFLARTPVISGTLSLTFEGASVEAFVVNNNSGELYCPGYPDRYLKVSYQGGYATIPAGIELAVASITLRMLERLKMSVGISAKEIGSVKTQFVGAGDNYSQIDQSIKAILAPYWRGSL